MTPKETIEAVRAQLNTEAIPHEVRLMSLEVAGIFVGHRSLFHYRSVVEGVGGVLAWSVGKSVRQSGTCNPEATPSQWVSWLTGGDRP